MMKGSFPSQVDTHYTRSINLERDVDSKQVLNAYIPTTKALQVVSKIEMTFSKTDMPRAWSLVGPYGSGKSSFAIFLTHLLENQELETSVTAENLLKARSPKLTKKITTHLKGSNAYCTILLTGSAESLSQRFLQAMYQSVKNYWSLLSENKPKVLEKIFTASKSSATISEIISLLDELQQAVLNVDGKGILIVIDELGKFLEYEARHQGANDIFLLQALAEYAYKGRNVNIMLVVLMHQAFDQYAKGMGETERNEWTKVQGRFENIPFLESSEQILRVVASAFKHTLNEQQSTDIEKQTVLIATVLDQQKALPSGLSKESAQTIFSRCYPLHPIVALLLPILCQKVAQNERTLFSYLGSQEHYGFTDALTRLENVGDWVLPWEIFEYFIVNQPIMTADYTMHRRWAEVLTAIERLGDAPDSEIQCLKTIGLFNIIGAQGGLKASRELLEVCFPKKTQVTYDLQQLQSKYIVNFRKFSAEFRIWEGSDFDLQSSLRETIEQQGRIDVTESLNQDENLLPIVARKHSIQTGTLRYFQPFYASVNSSIDSVIKPRIVFFLAESKDDITAFNKQYNKDDNLTIYVLCDNALQIKDAVVEVIALEKILTENPLIKSDPVAQRELKDSLTTAQMTKSLLLNQMLDQPEKNKWIWQGKQLNLHSKKELQEQLSYVLGLVYPKAPILKNELINRNKASAQGNSAKNKLVAALLNNEHKEDLGFDEKKYPPEKSIYRAVFKETGVHVKINGYWQITVPAKDNAYRLYPVWQAIDKLLVAGSKPKALTSIYEMLQQPPYGIQTAALPLIFVAYFLSKQRNLALYESGTFCPHVTQESFEILLKRPNLFTIESFEFSGLQSEVFNQYLEKIVGKSPEKSTLLDIVKPLAKFIHKLPEYTLSTKDIANQAIAVRDSFQQTQSPKELLFTKLPEACGFSAYTDEADFNENNPSDFLNVLVQNLTCLNKAYEQLLNNFKKQLTQAFNLDKAIDIAALRNELNQRYTGLENYTVDGIGLKAFIIRLQNNKETDKAWLESVAAFLGKAPAEKWKQKNSTEAEYNLKEYSTRLQQLAKIHNSEYSGGTLIRIVDGKHEISEVAYVTDDLKKQANEKIKQLKLDKADKQLKLTILTQLMNELSE